MGLEKCGIILGFLGFMFLSGLLSSMAQGNVHYYDFVLKETNFTKLCTTKSILTVNDSFPGPVIRVHKGDIVFVNVHNNGTYGVTIHWHGVKQPRNPWSDGPENITQCPIQPGSSFTQEVILSTEEGTIWWHAHSDWTRATVHGAFIILPANGTSYPFPDPDGEKTIVIGEWYKGDVMEIIEEALESGGEVNASDAFTINGQPGDLYHCSNETTSRFFVDYGKTYLFRIINSAMNEEQFFGIAQHNLTVVGSDAAYIKPISTTDYIMITPGQTMDVLVTTNQSPDFYYIASTPFIDGQAGFNNSTTTAILQYNGNYTPSSPIPFPSLPSYNNGTAAENFRKLLRSLASEDHPVNVPVNVTRSIYMTISVNQIYCENASCSGPDGNKLSASLNNISFQTPSIDVLQAYYKTLPHVFTKDFPDEPPDYFNFTADPVPDYTNFPTLGTKVIVLDYNESVEIVWQGTNVNSGENHPMHLHGFSFYVVGAGSGNFNNVTDPKTYNLIDPPEANTIGVPKNGWLAMRFFADNPGVWFMHCHLERHSSWGMSTVVIVKNGSTEATSILPPPKYMPPCS
ncbi:Laccase [Quillaja saponaria]|uniref:Laccase n=1 Tax=Quillaja saponaria TaxID=32244 RepID=A0AAD7PVU4_QUISA|nr:Laccase [Quillaja saponaria]